MPRNTDLITLRNKALCDKYRKLASVKEHGKPKYATEWILEELKLKHFYIDTATIWNIIRDEPEGGYAVLEEKDQLDLFKG